MAWKNYKRNYHRNRLAKRYINDWYSWQNNLSVYDVFEYTDKDKKDYIYEYEYYSRALEETYTRRAVDFHQAWKELSQEELWDAERLNKKAQKIQAKKLASGSYDTYRRLGGISVGKAWFGVQRKYARQVRHIGKYGHEEELDELHTQHSYNTHFGWWW